LIDNQPFPYQACKVDSVCKQGTQEQGQQQQPHHMFFLFMFALHPCRHSYTHDHNHIRVHAIFFTKKSKQKRW